MMLNAHAKWTVSVLLALYVKFWWYQAILSSYMYRPVHWTVLLKMMLILAGVVLTAPTHVHVVERSHVQNTAVLVAKSGTAAVIARNLIGRITRSSANPARPKICPVNTNQRRCRQWQLGRHQSLRVQTTGKSHRAKWTWNLVHSVISRRRTWRGVLVVVLWPTAVKNVRVSTGQFTNWLVHCGQLQMQLL